MKNSLIDEIQIVHNPVVLIAGDSLLLSYHVKWGGAIYTHEWHASQDICSSSYGESGLGRDSSQKAICSSSASTAITIHLSRKHKTSDITEMAVQ